MTATRTMTETLHLTCNCCDARASFEGGRFDRVASGWLSIRFWPETRVHEVCPTCAARIRAALHELRLVADGKNEP